MQHLEPQIELFDGSVAPVRPTFTNQLAKLVSDAKKHGMTHLEVSTHGMHFVEDALVGRIEHGFYLSFDHNLFPKILTLSLKSALNVLSLNHGKRSPTNTQ